MTSKLRKTSTTYRILPYKIGSESSQLLSDQLQIRQLFPPEDPRSRFNFNRRDGVIINWGRSQSLNTRMKLVNKPDDVATVADKLRFLSWCRNNEVQSVPWSTDKDEVKGWKGLVVERHVLNGHSGRGIRIADLSLGHQILDAPLYTKYIPKKAEYRVHFCDGQDIDIQEKKVRRGANPNYRVQNSANGFVYARSDVELPEACEKVVEDYIKKTPLTFGAIDVIYNERNNQAYILEVNTAPGLAPSTAGSYAQAFRAHLKKVT